jgi:putative membrane-bound dehydrogenase-like protein
MKSAVLCLLGFGMLHAQSLSLFDGKTLAGWQVRPGEEKWWTVRDGAITGGSMEQKVPINTFLASEKSYENFDLTYRLRLVKGTGFQNSGMQIRSIRLKNHEMKGYQVDGGIGYWGDLYDESRRAKLCGPLDPAALKAVVRDWDWNDYRVRCEGTQIRVWINGVQVTDYTEKDANIPANGFLGLQAHSGGTFLVQIKDVMIQELPPTPNSPKWADQEKPAEQKPKQGASTSGHLSPEDQLNTFKLPEGYVAELVSSEKQGTRKPITVAWDRHGKMWSMTATEYPLDANENKEAAAALYAKGGRDQILVFDEPNATGVQTPRIFAEGLAIPLGLLPMMDGVLVQYGTQIRRYIDDNQDGRADRHEVVLEGFGIQDSHLYVHQFERTPGGWIHLAQGAFNSSEVRRPNGLKFDDGIASVTFNHCKLGRFKPDGSLFQAQTGGPNNIWGLVISRTGETYIQEANDQGYPVMEFVTGSHYPTPFGPRMREDAPVQPASLKGSQMGGTGLSGLALAEDEGSPFAKDFSGKQVFYIPNPITSKIQIVTMTRDANGHPSYEKGPDFMLTDDKNFRPIAAHFGPDGCLYVVDWYNKIISHNEVARAHPDRDKSSGRIWRIRHKDQAVMPRIDLAKLDGKKLLDHLGGPNARMATMAWHEIVDRKETKLLPDLKKILHDAEASDARRLGALWALEGLKAVDVPLLVSLSKAPQATFRHEAARIAGEASLPEKDFLQVMQALRDDPHFRVRAMVINSVRLHPEATAAMVEVAAGYAKEPLPSGGRDAYDREFERYLSRWAMSAHAASTKTMMAETALPAEAMLLAARSVDGKEAALMMIKHLDQIQRQLNAQEMGLLAKYMMEPPVMERIRKWLGSDKDRPHVLAVMSQVDASVTSNPELMAAIGDACMAWLATSRNPANEGLVVNLARKFRISKLGDEVRSWTTSANRKPAELASGLATLREMKVLKTDDCESFMDHADEKVKREAVTGFASLSDPRVIEEFAKRWSRLSGALRSIARDGMTSNKSQAEVFAKALIDGKFGQVDAASVEKVSAVLGKEHPSAVILMKSGETVLTPEQQTLNEEKFRRYEALAKKAGDKQKGRALAEATCLICHQVNGKGLAIGPDLSGAGAMGVESLLRNILTPNEQLESGYYRHDVRLANDTVVSGFLAGETADSLKIRRIGADELVIPKKDISAHDISKRSLMPEGLIDGFTDQQVSDLFTYLNSLN